MSTSDRLIIDGFVVDLAVSIEEVGESEPTQFPVERGAPLNDHVIKKPRTRSIEFRVSDTPIGEMVNLRAAGSVPSSEARAFLEELQDSARPFVVEYRDRRWEEQIFTNLTFTEDAERSGGLFATAQLQTMVIVDVRRVVVEGLVVASVASAKVQGKLLWDCDGLPVSENDAENKQRGCRQVVKRSDGFYYYVDDGKQLNEVQVARLLMRVGPEWKWDPVTKQYYRHGVPSTVDAASEQAVRDGLNIPADYLPPSWTSQDDLDDFAGPRGQDTIRSGRNI